MLQGGLESGRGFATIDQKIALEEKMDTDFPRSTGEGVCREFIEGNLPIIQIERSNPDRKSLIKAALRFAVDPTHPAYCAHAFHGHNEQIVHKCVIELIEALDNGTAQRKTITALIKTNLSTDVGPKGLTKVPRIELSTPTEIIRPPLFIFETVGTLANIYDVESKQLNRRLLQSYARDLGLPFAIMTGLVSKVPVNTLLKELSTSNATKSSQIYKFAQLITNVQSELFTNRDGSLVLNNDVKERQAMRLLNEIGQRGLDQDQVDVLLAKTRSIPFSAAYKAIFATRGEQVMRYCPDNFRDPARSEYVFSEFNVKTMISKAITIFRDFDRVPFMEGDGANQAILTQFGSNKIIEHMRHLKG